MKCRLITCLSVAALVLVAAAKSIGPPTLIGPGVTNAPGPVVDNSLITFRWNAVAGATMYHLAIRDLATQDLETYDTPTTSFQLPVTAGHPYRWNVIALQGTNESLVSESYYFQPAILPVHPVVTSVLPSPAPAIDHAQVLVVSGSEFRKGMSVVLRDKTTGESFSNLAIRPHYSSQFVIAPNFAKAAGPWSVEVINPGGFSSGEFPFAVVAPAQISRWLWWRSGWPWAWVGLLVIAGLAIWLWHTIRRIPAAVDEGRRGEHERLSRDLHDSLNDLNQVSLLAGKLKVMVENSQPSEEIRGTSGRVSSTVIEAVNILEDMVWAGRKENANLADLVARLRQKLGQFRECYPEVHCTIEFPLDLPPRSVNAAFNEHLLRTASEALRNIAKHASATEVRCNLSLANDRLLLTFGDNGRGFRTDQVETSGRGIANLRRRAEELGGHISWKSAPGQGTQLKLEVALR